MSRKYFGTDGIRGLANKHPITAEFAMKFGIAAGSFFSKKNDDFRVVIGKDTRRSCYMIESALTAGLIGIGAKVMWLGPIPTPAIGMITRSMRADFGIMISASHNPFYDNGIKLFDKNGYKLSDSDEKEIEALIDNFDSIVLSDASHLGRTIRYDNAQARYIELVKGSFPKNLTLEGLKIVVDCAHGAAYRVAPEILFELGADVIPIGVTPDGYNINQECGVMHPISIQENVLKHKADLGIALDGDADRLLLCDHLGTILDGDLIIGIIATALKEKNLLSHNHVITTIMSNMALRKYLTSIGVSTSMTAVGDRYVVEEMRKKKANLGGEQSGHVILSDYATTGDGLVAALQILAEIQLTGKTLKELSSIFTPYPQKLINLTYKDKNPLENDQLQAYLKKAQDHLNEKGRILVRKSGTEPVIRVMAEAEEQILLDTLLQDVSQEVEKYLH